MGLETEKVEKFVAKLEKEGILEFEELQKITQQDESVDEHLETIRNQLKSLEAKGNEEMPLEVEKVVQRELAEVDREFRLVEEELVRAEKQVDKTRKEIETLMEGISDDAKGS